MIAIVVRAAPLLRLEVDPLPVQQLTDALVIRRSRITDVDRAWLSLLATLATFTVAGDILFQTGFELDLGMRLDEFEWAGDGKALVIEPILVNTSVTASVAAHSFKRLRMRHRRVPGACAPRNETKTGIQEIEASKPIKIQIPRRENSNEWSHVVTNWNSNMNVAKIDDGRHKSINMST